MNVGGDLDISVRQSFVGGLSSVLLPAGTSCPVVVEYSVVGEQTTTDTSGAAVPLFVLGFSGMAAGLILVLASDNSKDAEMGLIPTLIGGLIALIGVAVDGPETIESVARLDVRVWEKKSRRVVYAFSRSSSKSGNRSNPGNLLTKLFSALRNDVQESRDGIIRLLEDAGVTLETHEAAIQRERARENREAQARKSTARKKAKQLYALARRGDVVAADKLLQLDGRDDLKLSAKVASTAYNVLVADILGQPNKDILLRGFYDRYPDGRRYIPRRYRQQFEAQDSAAAEALRRQQEQQRVAQLCNEEAQTYVQVLEEVRDHDYCEDEAEDVQSELSSSSPDDDELQRSAYRLENCIEDLSDRSSQTRAYVRQVQGQCRQSNKELHELKRQAEKATEVYEEVGEGLQPLAKAGRRAATEIRSARRRQEQLQQQQMLKNALSNMQQVYDAHLDAKAARTGNQELLRELRANARAGTPFKAPTFRYSAPSYSSPNVGQYGSYSAPSSLGRSGTGTQTASAYSANEQRKQEASSSWDAYTSKQQAKSKMSASGGAVAGTASNGSSVGSSSGLVLQGHDKKAEAERNAAIAQAEKEDAERRRKIEEARSIADLTPEQVQAKKRACKGSDFNLMGTISYGQTSPLTLCEWVIGTGVSDLNDAKARKQQYCSRMRNSVPRRQYKVNGPPYCYDSHSDYVASKPEGLGPTASYGDHPTFSLSGDCKCGFPEGSDRLACFQEVTWSCSEYERSSRNGGVKRSRGL